MDYVFNTYGPFTLARKGGSLREDAIRNFWREVEEEQPKLKSGIGVYIIGTKRKSRPVKPWYVGKTDMQGFGRRFDQHSRIFKDLGNSAPNGHLAVFLIARLTPRTSAFKKKGTRLNSVDMLEFMFIGACFSQNDQLLNMKKTSLHKGLIVPGYLNARRGKPSAAANHLKSMLLRPTSTKQAKR